MKYLALFIVSESLFFRYKLLLKEIKPKYKALLCSYDKIEDKSIPYVKLKPGKEIRSIEEKIGKDNKVKLVLNRLDSHIEIASELIDYFQVPGPSAKAVSFFRDKAKLNDLMEEHGLAFYRPTSIVTDLDKIESALKRVQFPVAIKPHIGAHSRAVLKIGSLEEFENNRDIYLKHFSAEKALRTKGKKFQNKILVEEFIEGKFVVPCTYISEKGKVINLAYLKVVRALELGQNNLQLIYRSTPSQFSDVTQKKIKYILQRLSRITDLKSTFIDPEFILKKGKIYLIEINPRMGGFRYQTMRHAFGIDIEKMSLQLALGREVDDDLQEINSCTACEIWEEKSGIVKKFEVPKSKYIRDLSILISKGEKYQAPPQGNKALGKFYVKTTDGDSLSIAKKIRKKINIIIE